MADVPRDAPNASSQSHPTFCEDPWEYPTRRAPCYAEKPHPGLWGRNEPHLELSHTSAWIHASSQRQAINPDRPK